MLEGIRQVHQETLVISYTIGLSYILGLQPANRIYGQAGWVCDVSMMRWVASRPPLIWASMSRCWVRRRVSVTRPDADKHFRCSHLLFVKKQAITRSRTQCFLSSSRALHLLNMLWRLHCSTTLIYGISSPKEKIYFHGNKMMMMKDALHPLVP